MTVNQQQIDNLVNMLDGYVEQGGHHLNVNVFTRETLLDAQAHPEKQGVSGRYGFGKNQKSQCEIEKESPSPETGLDHHRRNP